MVSQFTEEEIAAEYARRNKERLNRDNPMSSHQLECVHCHCEFNPAAGGNASIPICDRCLHGD